MLTYTLYTVISLTVFPCVQWLFVGIAGSSALLYSVMFLSTTVRVYWSLRKKQSELASLTMAAQQRFQGLFFQLKFFIAVTVIVAMCSIATVILPTEIMLHQWQHGNNDYSIYSECRVCIVMCMYLVAEFYCYFYRKILSSIYMNDFCNTIERLYVAS